MHNVHIGKSPRYLADIVHAAYFLQSDALRPALSLSLWDRQLHHTSAAHQVRRAGFFSFSGPASWNSLPAELRTISDTSVFKNKLKTYLFGLAFDIRTQ